MNLKKDGRKGSRLNVWLRRGVLTVRVRNLTRLIWSLSVRLAVRVRNLTRLLFVKAVLRLARLIWFLSVRLVLRPIRWLALFQKPSLTDTECTVFPPQPKVLEKPGKIAWIFSLTGVANEPRVVRQARALNDAGWTVVVFGHQGHSPTPDFWFFVKFPSQLNLSPAHYIWWAAIRRAAGQIQEKTGGPISAWFGRVVYTHYDQWRYIRKAVGRISSSTRLPRPDLVVAHDYQTCGMAYDMVRKFSAKFTVDCHEYSAGQFMHDPYWVAKHRPVICAVQDFYLARADAVTTVCKGIAEHLNREQKLRQPVSVLRSVPFMSKQDFRPTGDKITVLYHGDVSYVRGLHKAIKSVPQWRDEFHLLIRGGGDANYLDYLRNLAIERGVSERVHFEPPVPFDQIIPAANAADIGYFVHKDVSPQKRYVLPNKFFEYIMAGLALCVSRLPEMARIVDEYQIGVLVDDYAEAAIAQAINSFDRNSIDALKKRSLEAAYDLNWESEQKKMLELYSEICC